MPYTKGPCQRSHTLFGKGRKVSEAAFVAHLEMGEAQNRKNWGMRSTTDLRTCNLPSFLLDFSH